MKNKFKHLFNSFLFSLNMGPYKSKYTIYQGPHKNKKLSIFNEKELLQDTILNLIEEQEKKHD